MATTVEQLEQGTPTTLLSTELNSLANNTNVISSVGGSSGAFNNVQATSNFNAYIRAKIELNLAAPGGTFTASTSINFWFIKTVDGTNYEDGASVTPVRAPDVVFPVQNTASAQRVIRECRLPVGTFKCLARNAGTGQTLGASGNTVKILPNTDQSV